MVKAFFRSVLSGEDLESEEDLSAEDLVGITNNRGKEGVDGYLRGGDVVRFQVNTSIDWSWVGNSSREYPIL
ncbi:MAG: hypothetical protein LVT47_02870 [Cyanobacteria bacterium LVE1205-1]